MIKRGLDVSLAGTMLVLLSPVLLVTAVAIRVIMGSPVLFRHVRPGYLGQPFDLLKFRSMRPGIDADGRALTPAERVTALGRLLRRTSIDELPQLWNVMRGDMSLVGPRPLLMEYLSKFTAEQARRHNVRPGITGLAQIRGRHLLDFAERFRLDTWYADHWSLALDVKILVLTPLRVIKGTGMPVGTVNDDVPDWDRLSR